MFTACHRFASIGGRENTQPGLLPAADELQHDFSPVRPGAVLGDVDALPDPECERSRDHGDVERHAREHGLYMRRRSEEHTSELQSQSNLVCRLLLEKKKKKQYIFFLLKKKKKINNTK